MIRYAIVEGWTLVRERWLVNCTLAVLIAVPLALAGLTWEFRSWVDPLLSSGTEALATAVLLRSETDDESALEWVRRQATAHPDWQVRLVPPDELEQRLTRWFPTLNTLLDEERQSLLPTVVEISAGDIGTAQVLANDPMVLAVGPGSSLSRQLRLASNRISLLAALVSLSLLAVGMLVVSVSVHLELFRHAEEISIMRLVGATEGTIHSPFLVASVVPGTGAAVLAAFVTSWLGRQLSASAGYVGLPQLPSLSFIMVVEALVALILPVTVTLLTLRRHATAETPS